MENLSDERSFRHIPNLTLMFNWCIEYSFG